MNVRNNVSFKAAIKVSLTKDLPHIGIPLEITKFQYMLNRHKIPNNTHMILGFEDIEDKNKALWLFTGETAQKIEEASRNFFFSEFDNPDECNRTWNEYFVKFKTLLKEAYDSSQVLVYKDINEKIEKSGFNAVKKLLK